MVFSGIRESGLVTRFADGDCAVGVWRDVVIAVWRKRTHLDGIAAVKECVEERSRLFKQVALLQVIEDDAAPPDALARKSLARLHSQQAVLIRCSAVVYGKPGFAGATARAIITGVALLNPPKFDHEIFSNIGTAVQWICASPGSSKAADVSEALAHAVGQLRLLDVFVPSRLTGSGENQ